MHEQSFTSLHLPPDRCQIYHERSFLPHNISFLQIPLLTSWLKRHVKAPQQLGCNQTHLRICQAAKTKTSLLANIFSSAGTLQGMNTHFLPRQLRGPYENGWRASLLSAAKRGSLSSSHRSGIKESDIAKLELDRKAEKYAIVTDVCQLSAMVAPMYTKTIVARAKTYPFRNEMVFDNCPSRRHFPGEDTCNRRVHSQGFFQNRIQVPKSRN